MPTEGPMSKRRLAINAAFTAVLLYWAANALYTATKALSRPYNGPVAQYLAMTGQDRIAAAVDRPRLESDLLRPSVKDALQLVHACHAEISRQFSISDGDGTGIDHLLQSKEGLCFDFCGATYALALFMMREHAQYMGRTRQIRWVRGFASKADTLDSSHSWLEAVGPDGRWHGYDAAIDPQTDGANTAVRPLEEHLLSHRYYALNRKQADLGGRVTTSLAWPGILLARKNLIEEAVDRLSLPRPLALPAKAAVLLLLFAAAYAALGRKGGRRGTTRQDAADEEDDGQA